MKPLSRSPPKSSKPGQPPSHCVAMRFRDNCSVRAHASRATEQSDTPPRMSVGQAAQKEVDSYLAPACQSGPKGTQTTTQSHPARYSPIFARGHSVQMSKPLPPAFSLLCLALSPVASKPILFYFLLLYFHLSPPL